FPVLDTKAIKSELTDSEPATLLHSGADALDATAMAFDPRQAALPRPPTVAVHDDGDMLGQSFAFKARRGQPLQRSGAKFRPLWRRRGVVRFAPATLDHRQLASNCRKSFALCPDRPKSCSPANRGAGGGDPHSVGRSAVDPLTAEPSICP